MVDCHAAYSGQGGPETSARGGGGRRTWGLPAREGSGGGTGEGRDGRGGFQRGKVAVAANKYIISGDGVRAVCRALRPS